MVVKLKYKFYLLWIYILSKVHKIINDRIFKDTENLYVVYYDYLIKDVYICENGKEALKLVSVLNDLNTRLNRTQLRVLYGKASYIFKFKMVNLIDICFTFNCSYEQKQKMFSYIADVPVIK